MRLHGKHHSGFPDRGPKRKLNLNFVGDDAEAGRQPVRDEGGYPFNIFVPPVQVRA